MQCETCEYAQPCEQFACDCGAPHCGYPDSAPQTSAEFDLENVLDQHAHVLEILLQRLALKDDCPFWKKEVDS